MRLVGSEHRSITTGQEFHLALKRYFIDCHYTQSAGEIQSI